MAAEPSPDIIKTTQLSLGKFVKRPPLSDKLLKKPPFRFLHDIITSVLKTTGFFNGLFEENELISDNVKDRESKILFLNKVISVISTTTGKKLSVKSSKIVAGQEPEKTNELLQCLASALDSNLSSDEAVKLYKETIKSNTSGERKLREKDSTKTVKNNTDVRKVTTKDSEKLIKSNRIPKTKEKETINVGKEQTKKFLKPSKTTIKNVSHIDKEKQDTKKLVSSATNLSPKENSIQKTFTSDPTIDVIQVIQDKQITSLPSLSNEIGKIDTSIDSKTSLLTEHPQETLKSEDEFKDNNLEITGKNLELTLNNSDEIKSGDNNEENINKQQEILLNQNIQSIKLEKDNSKEANTEESDKKVTDISNVRPSSVRPFSSRPGAPRLRDKHDNIITSSENLVLGKVNIIAERTNNEEEEESSIVVVDTANVIDNLDESELQVSPNQHGHLVQKILEAQKEYSQGTGKTEIEWQFGAQKARDMVTQEIEQLRFNVQALSRVANPLGKVLDHIQEDVEVMRQELNQWTKIYEESTKELLKEKAANEETLFPFHTKIKQLHSDIAEKQDKINDLKIVIHKNTMRIEKLLSRGNVQ